MAENGISTLPTKQERQLAKLALASVKRAIEGKPSSFDIGRLPARYVGNTSVPNLHPNGLLPGRPWLTSITVPGAPTIGTATAGIAQATVTFTAPANNGGATITSYTVTSNPGNITAIGAASPITVANLPDGTAYTFTATNIAGTGPASAASNSVIPAPIPVLDQISPTTAAAAYSLRKLRSAYAGNAIRVRRSSDNAEANFGFATAAQTRTNLAAIPINNDTGQTVTGITMTTIGTGIEFGQPYIDVRWQGTAGSTAFLTLGHGPRGVFNPALQAPVTPGLNYTASVGYRLLAGTFPTNPSQVDALFFSAAGAFIAAASSAVPPATAALQRSAASGPAPAGGFPAAYCQPIWRVLVSSGTEVNFTMRFYAANVEQAIGNARPLLQRDVPETIAAIGELDAEALLSFVGSGSGFVTIWYDQSGNIRNAFQNTTTQQPRIIINGALQTEGGKPAILFDGIDDGLAALSWGNISQPFSRHYIGVRKSFSGISHWINSTEGIPNTAQYDYDGIFHAMFAGSAVPVTLINNERAVLSAVFNGASSYISKNGVLTTGNPGPQAFSGVRIGGWYNINEFCSNVAMQELIVVAEGSVISTVNRQTIELNQSAYYGIPLLALDLISVPSQAAYSLRKLRSAYTGNAIRVRRSSDNAEADIGFTLGGDLNTAALINHVGSGPLDNGFITTWYDQSGNGRNAAQTTPGGQPRIVTNGAIETQNGQPAPRFDGFDDVLVFQGVHDAQWSLAVVGRMNGASQGFLQFGGVNQFGSILTEFNVYMARASTGFVPIDVPATAPFTPGEIAVLTATYGVAQTNIWKNGIIGTPSAAAGVASNATSYIGALQFLYYLNGNIGEIIVLNGVLSTTNRQTLERNQGAYYGITIT